MVTASCTVVVCLRMCVVCVVCVCVCICGFPVFLSCFVRSSKQLSQTSVVSFASCFDFHWVGHCYGYVFSFALCCLLGRFGCSLTGPTVLPSRPHYPLVQLWREQHFAHDVFLTQISVTIILGKCDTDH